jgi:uncharacterized protein YbjT (DUF2867 family)
MNLQDEARSGRSALVLGATGLVGGHCVELLLADRAYSSVSVAVRRPLERIGGKLTQHVVDFDRLEEQTALFAVDDVYCCLGTTIRRAGSQEAFLRVDVEYPASAARLALSAGADQFLAVSAVGADPQSRVFYNRAKGEMESRIRRLPFRAVWMIRPSLLLGEREEVRLGEKVAEVVSRPLAPLMLGRLRRYRPVRARDVAAAMIALALSGGMGGIIESEEIPDLARRAP